MYITVQIVGGSEAGQSTLIYFLKERGCRVFFSASGKRALAQIKRVEPDMLFVSLDMSDVRGVDFLKKIQKNGRDMIVATLVDSIQQGIETMKRGAEYYFCKPCNFEEVRIVLQQFIATRYYREGIDRLRHWYLHQLEKNELVLVTKEMKELYQQAVKFAGEPNTPVLLAGEAGTGRELLAKIIHYRSPHSLFPFIPIDCCDRKTALLDRYIRDIKKTGDGKKSGEEFLLLPTGGTLLMHAIECLPKSEQAKLLKYLKGLRMKRGKKVDRTVSGKRIMVLTSVNLRGLVDKGKFNKELYQLLSKRSIQIPPLRKRSAAIVPLAMHFIKGFNREYGKKVKRIDPEVKQYIESYNWPGNVSELKNVIEHGVICSQGENISMREMEFRDDKRVMPLETLLLNGSFLSLDEMVALYVKSVLKKVKGNKSKAAKLLRVSRNTLKKKSVVV